jgi:DNA repair protein RadA/Sms
MAKVKPPFFVRTAAHNYAKWQGQCNSCKEWNTIAEEIIKKRQLGKPTSQEQSSKPLKINEIDSTQESGWILLMRNLIAYLVAVLFLDHLFLEERPGNRKSTFTSNILKITYKTLYVSGEEAKNK